MDSNEILVKKKDLLERLTVDIIKKKFNIEPPFKPEDIIKLESFKVNHNHKVFDLIILFFLFFRNTQLKTIYAHFAFNQRNEINKINLFGVVIVEIAHILVVLNINQS